MKIKTKRVNLYREKRTKWNIKTRTREFLQIYSMKWNIKIKCLSFNTEKEQNEISKQKVWVFTEKKNGTKYQNKTRELIHRNGISNFKTVLQRKRNELSKLNARFFFFYRGTKWDIEIKHTSFYIENERNELSKQRCEFLQRKRIKWNIKIKRLSFYSEKNRYEIW